MVTKVAMTVFIPVMEPARAEEHGALLARWAQALQRRRAIMGSQAAQAAQVYRDRLLEYIFDTQAQTDQLYKKPD